jgi:hypothetical protein
MALNSHNYTPGISLEKDAKPIEKAYADQKVAAAIRSRRMDIGR